MNHGLTNSTAFILKQGLIIFLVFTLKPTTVQRLKERMLWVRGGLVGNTNTLPSRSGGGVNGRSLYRSPSSSYSREPSSATSVNLMSGEGGDNGNGVSLNPAGSAKPGLYPSVSFEAKTMLEDE